MTVHELKEMLEDYENDGYGDLEVRMAEQPSWPLASDVSAVSRGSWASVGSGLADKVE